MVQAGNFLLASSSEITDLQFYPLELCWRANDQRSTGCAADAATRVLKTMDVPFLNCNHRLVVDDLDVSNRNLWLLPNLLDVLVNGHFDSSHDRLEPPEGAK
jgi:hypothetical protein